MSFLIILIEFRWGDWEGDSEHQREEYACDSIGKEILEETSEIGYNGSLQVILLD